MLESRVFVCVSVTMYAHAEARAEYWVSSSMNVHLVVLEKGLPRNQKLSTCAKLPGQRGLPVSAPKCWGYRLHQHCVYLCTCVLKVQTQASCWQAQEATISLAPFICHLNQELREPRVTTKADPVSCWDSKCESAHPSFTVTLFAEP